MSYPASPSSKKMPESSSRQRQLVAGVTMTVVVALAARFVDDQLGIPDMLVALLLGIALHSVIDHDQSRRGIAFTASAILRFGIVLLGARITLYEIQGLGLSSLVTVLAAIVATILAGILGARLLGFRGSFGALTGGATAICGASAALALAAVLPRHDKMERETSVTILGVTVLSSIAMLLYPLLGIAFGFSESENGLLLGATIHDVAQVVGAGYSMSVEIGDQATLTKLLRVALLLPAVFIIGLTFGARRGDESRAPVPAFLLGFLALVCWNTWVGLDPSLRDVLVEVSRWFLLMAVAAIGIKTPIGAVVTIGPRALGLLVMETVFLLTFILVVILGFSWI
ncbi:putative sulfate exporter family transporter [Pelagibius sp. CAU 1746]|uniref:YeiH family protein n=1 Tax=Pelagibius sp. CAU 1746 TaxID=3140370 RepID=UPI00325A7848